MKKQNPSTLLLVIVLFGLGACQGKKSEPASTESAPAAAPAASSAASEAALAEGKKIFNTYCILCHGADGKLGLNGSKDLTISTITTEERIIQVTNGKGLMTPFKEILTEAEIKAVVSYTETLKK